MSAINGLQKLIQTKATQGSAANFSDITVTQGFPASNPDVSDQNTRVATIGAVNSAVATVKSDILGNHVAAYDTLGEISRVLDNDASSSHLTNLTGKLGGEHDSSETPGRFAFLMKPTAIGATETSTLSSRLNDIDGTNVSTTLASRIASTEAEVTANAAAISASVSAAQAAVNSEASIRATNDGTLQANITAEIANEASIRYAADGTLQANINAEANARYAADATLQTNINTLDASVVKTSTSQNISGAKTFNEDVTVSGILTYDKARCGNTGEVFENNIKNSVALAANSTYRFMTAGNNVAGTLIFALNRSGVHCYFEVKFSSCFWHESSLRVVNHHGFTSMGIDRIDIESPTTAIYPGTFFNLHTVDPISANELTVNLKNAYTADDYALVDFLQVSTGGNAIASQLQLNGGVNIKTTSLSVNTMLFGGVRSNVNGDTISKFQFDRTGKLHTNSIAIGLNTTMSAPSSGIMNVSGAVEGDSFKVHNGTGTSWPLISQVHSFIQTSRNPISLGSFFTHAPHRDADGNLSNSVFGMKSVGNIVPYALVIGTDLDGESITTFTFQVRARTNTGNVAYLTTATTNSHGTAAVAVQEDDTARALFYDVQTIEDNTSWGLYLSNMSPNGYNGEIVVKVYFYQV